MSVAKALAALFVSTTCVAVGGMHGVAHDDDSVDLPRIVQYQLLSLYSGRFIGETGDGCIHAMGDIRDPRTKFVPRIAHDGKWAFESYCKPGQYIVVYKLAANNSSDIKLRLGTPRNNSEQFEQVAPFPGIYAYKSSSPATQDCYMAFDSFGNSHDDILCNVDTSHMASLIRYIESVEETICEHTHLKSSRFEL
jgi:hypothetical protein